VVEAAGVPKPPPPPTFVLDPSLALSWFFADDHDPYAKAVGRRLASASAVVPATWPLEVANAILATERLRRSTPAQASAWLGYLRDLPIVIDPDTAGRAWSATLDLGRQHAISAHDAAYLELALRKSLPIATLDDVLRAAAREIGIKAYTP
jgi:predicted nucleic acid-binding protein